MNELQQELFEKQLVSISQGLDYPRTPNIAGAVMEKLRQLPSPTRAERSVSEVEAGRGAKGRPRFISKRFAWSLTVILIVLSSLMLIPPARAAIIEFIQIGIVRIFRAEPTPATPPQEEAPSAVFLTTATPALTSEPLIPVLERLAGELTLEEAEQKVSYPILLPSYPPDLGPPDRVFVQDAEGDMTILIWIDPQQPSQVLMSLHFIPKGSWAISKMGPTLIEETRVNNQRAIWAVGPYPIQFSNGDMDFVRLVDGHVLIWTEGETTYRLETDLNLEEAINVAESLEPAR